MGENVGIKIKHEKWLEVTVRPLSKLPAILSFFTGIRSLDLRITQDGSRVAWAQEMVYSATNGGLMNQALWEPWRPEVGDYVEVWISAECVCTSCGGHAHGDWWDSVEGYRGTVRQIRRADNVACRSCGLYIRGHYYLIAGEHMGEEEGRRAYGWAAAIEMRKVNP